MIIRSNIRLFTVTDSHANTSASATATELKHIQYMPLAAVRLIQIMTFILQTLQTTKDELQNT